MSQAPRSTPPPQEAEALLASLAGVVSAHVVYDGEGDIVEIHILSAPHLHPKQVVRNVESALSAGLGIAIDRRVVSVAQIRTAGGTHRNGGDSPDAGRGAAGPTTEAAAATEEEEAAPRRLEFVRYQARRQADGCTCEVVLRDQAGEVTGTGAGADTAEGRAEAAARAVLGALAAARPELRLELDGATISSARGRGYVIVSAHAVLDREPQRLAGAAPISRSPEEAAILAALQATNRWSA